MNPNYITSPEIRHLIQPREPSEYAELQASILAEGCHEPVTVWQDTIVDGWHRWNICERFNIPYEVKDISDKPWQQVIRDVCDAQLQRADISFAMRRYLVGKSFHAILEERKEQYLASHPNRQHLPLHAVPKQKTAREVAGEFNMSYATILKYEAYAAAVDIIREKYEPLANTILFGSVRLSQDNATQLAQLPVDELADINRSIERGEIEHIDSNLIHRHLGLAAEPEPTALPPEDPTPAVRQMPAYDPDAELSSLTYTIPSWVRSIERAQDNCDLTQASMKAKLKLIQSLHLLEHTVGKFKNEMEDNYLYG